MAYTSKNLNHKKFNYIIFIFLIIAFFGVGCHAQTAEDYYNEGNKFYESGDYDKAIVSYKEALNIEPKLIGAFNNLANIYFYNKKDYEKAEQVCLEGLSYYPSDPSLILIMMYLDFELGRVDEGIARYTFLSQKNLSQQVTFPMLAFAEAMKKRGLAKDEITQTYIRLLKINPKDYILLYEVAEYLKDKARYQEALDTYKRVIELHPHKEVAYVGMGSCYYNLGEAHLALEYFQKAKTAGQYVPEAFFEKLEKELQNKRPPRE